VSIYISTMILYITIIRLKMYSLYSFIEMLAQDFKEELLLITPSNIVSCDNPRVLYRIFISKRECDGRFSTKGGSEKMKEYYREIKNV